jgi:translation initiation factor IF-3
MDTSSFPQTRRPDQIVSGKRPDEGAGTYIRQRAEHKATASVAGQIRRLVRIEKAEEQPKNLVDGSCALCHDVRSWLLLSFTPDEPRGGFQERRKASLPGINERHTPHDRRDQHQRVNEQIRISPVRLIGANGDQLGVVPTAQALEMAREAQLDLVEVAANERPPVCKIMDFGKFKFLQKQKQKDKTKSHHQKLKEIRVRPKTGDHDVDTKVNQARKFLEHKDKVLVYVVFKGRELQHIEEGRRIMGSILEKLADLAKVEKSPSMEGKRMTAMLAPK